MFGNRRKRASSQSSLTGSNVNPNATTAAAQAFLKNRSSNASLASAAAGAALRSRPTTPTSVADVQTKRTLKRASSTASMASTGSSRPQLERRGSSGSMSERSFRDPSPNRASQPVPSAVDAPPVPAIPQNIQQPPIPPKSHRRANSMEAPPMRVASPPPNKATGRGSSLGPGSTPTPRRAGQRKSSLSSVSELTSTERPASRGSVNFSYPRGSRPTSPVEQRRLTSPSSQRTPLPRITSPTNQNLVYDPNTRSFLPAAEVLAIEQRLYDAANPVVKKKKQVATQPAPGSHLADGTVGGRPRGTAIDAMEAASSQSSKPAEPPAPAPALMPAPIAAAPVPKKKKKKVVVMSDSDSDQASYAPYSSDTDSDASRTGHFNTRAGALLAKKPSIVQEDREREEQEDETPPRANVTDGLRLDTGPQSTRPISPTPLPRSSAGRGHGRGQASASAAFAQERQQTRSTSQPASAPLGASAVESIPPLAAKGSIRDGRGGRVQSVSPARTHFATSTDSLQVKHNPPGRSISPRKSALKHPSTPGGPSPSDGDFVGVAQTTSETSDDLSVPRKKANRVSFDESNVVVGQAATPVTTDSPMVSSPQTKRPWYSIGRGNKKQTSMADEVDDETMKPRPALPSFGSVRKNKDKSQEEEKERPLVKPAAPSDRATSPTLFTTANGEVIDHQVGQSYDHGVGSVISQDAASKNAANISRSREPLPPQVTSVEGSGYSSDTNSSLTSLNSPLGAAKIEGGNTTDKDETSREIPTPIPQEKEGHHEGTNGAVPEISVLQATPTLEETASRREWPEMPGGWRNSNSLSDSGGSQGQEEAVSPVVEPIVEHHATDPTPDDAGIAEPDPSTPRAGSPVVGEIAIENSHAHNAILEEPEESDASVYSDAAEDLSDIEGDGFLSLDAVVESPVSPKFPMPLAFPEPESPTPKATKERAYRKSQLSKKSSEPALEEGWDKAQEYWKSLTADKKRQLEAEARAEAEGSEGSDTEIEAKSTPKPKKKKKVKMAAAPVFEQQPPSPVNNRTYMIPPGSKAGPNGHASMRSSMRAESISTAQDPHIRTSMRGPNSKRNSLRASEQPEPRGALQKKTRPMSMPASEREFKPDQAAVEDLVRKMTQAKANSRPVSTQAPSPNLRRRGSGDSNSSFKRARSGSASEIPSFRRSMRASNETNNSGRHDSPAGSSRFSLRSLSPTGSTMRRPFNSGGTTSMNSNPSNMRMSMRNSTGPAPTMRGNNSASRAKSPLRSIPGFGRSSSTKPTKQKATPKRSSRFADSSDEDEGPQTFRSRFNDSDSSDDEPLPARNAG
ncbi:hypothetical protein LSUE1_G010095, partial [Lachnellula suecica]